MQSALRLLQQNGYLTLTDAQDNPARIMFCISRDELYKLRIRRDDLDPFIRTLLRLYNGVFTEFRPINEGELAAWSGYTVDRVRELLKLLWQLRVIRYIPSNRSPILYLNEERLPRADLYIAPETYRRRQELMRERFERMIAYADNEQECRSVVLERYFGADDATPCGVCDLCLARKRTAREGRPKRGGASGGSRRNGSGRSRRGRPAHAASRSSGGRNRSCPAAVRDIFHPAGTTSRTGAGHRSPQFVRRRVRHRPGRSIACLPAARAPRRRPRLAAHPRRSLCLPARTAGRDPPPAARRGTHPHHRRRTAPPGRPLKPSPTASVRRARHSAAHAACTCRMPEKGLPAASFLKNIP